MPRWGFESQEARDKYNARRAKRRAKKPPPNWEVFNGTFELFQYFWDRQKGKCAICKKELSKERGIHKRADGTLRPFFDHCHKTLVARGILCYSCNGKLGWYEQYRKQIKRYLAGQKEI